MQTTIPLFKVFPTPSYKEFNKHLDKLIEIGHNCASKYVSDIKDRAAMNDEKFHGMSLLEQWLIEGNMNASDAVSQSINMMAAGMDTVSY